MDAGPRRTMKRWRSLALLALPGLTLVLADRTQATAPPPEPPDQPVELPKPPVDAPNLPSPPVTESDEAVVPGSYLVVMAADPVVAYDGGEPGLPATEVGPGEQVEPSDPAVEQYVAFLESEQDAALAGAGIDSAAQGATFTYTLNGFEANLSEQQAADLARQPQVAKVVPNTIRQLQTDTSPEFLGLTARNGPWASGVTGEDVVVGILDSGIWPEHASFADDGSYAPLPGYDGLECDFGNTAYNTDDAPFECNNKLLGAYDFRDAYKEVYAPYDEPFDSARDYDGHGTHVASTAAGNRDVPASIFGVDRGLVSGIAPRARVIAYSVCGINGCFTSDTIDALDQAVADGVDVINYSIGGGPSLTDPGDLAFLFAADAGIWTATSASNDGPGPETIGGPASVPWLTAVGANTHDRTFENTATLGDGGSVVGVSITAGTDGPKPLVDAAALGNELCDSTEPFSADITGKVVLCLRGGNARVDKSKAVFDAGGAGMILYNPNDAQALVTDNHWVPSTHVNFTSGQAVKAYIAAAGAGATAALSAGEAVETKGSVMADFSSRGPNTVAPDIIKPDITGPGVNILAGHTPASISGDKPGELFQSISGTSMSSPHIAGVFALLRQSHPDWSAAAAKSAVMTSARQDVVKEDGTTPADPFDMGAGHVDPAGRPDRDGSLFSPGLVYDAGFFEYLGFLCDADDSAFVNPAATCGFLAGQGVPTTATDLNLASIGASDIPGTLTVKRTVTSVANRRTNFNARVEAPPGFDVKVEPRQLRLEPGQSATFTVTFTNRSAPADVWRFGALTWVGSGHEVRSPIAVKGSLLAAPEVVSGTGTQGSVNIPVTFGYTGPYQAGAHGPVPPTLVTGTVAQDPDQTFDPSDPIGTTAVPITVSGSAFLRLALDTADLTPPDPNTDIDLYLFDEAGDFIDQSAASGTAELIEVPLPEDGTYTLYVHGWAVPGGSAGFSLRSWSVPIQPGTGALQITSAPTSVTIGQQATIVASWSGLQPATEYLGAVSHSRGDELLGLTLVEIDT